MFHIKAILTRPKVCQYDELKKGDIVTNVTDYSLVLLLISNTKII